MLYIKIGENTLFRYGDIAITEIIRKHNTIASSVERYTSKSNQYEFMSKSDWIRNLINFPTIDVQIQLSLKSWIIEHSSATYLAIRIKTWILYQILYHISYFIAKIFYGKTSIFEGKKKHVKLKILKQPDEFLIYFAQNLSHTDYKTFI